jgi:Sulfotransferase domain
MDLPHRAKRTVVRALNHKRFRAASARMRILPSFLIIGAQRAGTTTFFNQLMRHPDICGPSGTGVSWARKELHFFDEHIDLGPNWYREFFPLVTNRGLARLRGGDLQAGEATPYYLFDPRVPERVAAVLPDVRLVALLRDPVDRAYSHYQMMIRSNREHLSFEAALAVEEERLAGAEELAEGLESAADRNQRRKFHHRHHSYFSRGLYADQLERWLTCFPRSQLFILEAEDFFARPAEIYPEALAFLGVRKFELEELPVTATTASPGKPWSNKKTRNRASYEQMRPDTRAELEGRFAEPNVRLAELLGREFRWAPRLAELPS